MKSPIQPFARLLLLAFLVLPAAAQTTLIGDVYDGNGGPLLGGQVYHTAGFTVPSGQTLTMEPGAILKVDGGSILLFGHFTASSTTGLAYVTSIHDDLIGGDTNGNGGSTSASPGDWGGFRIANGGSLYLDGVELRWGGGGTHAPVHMEGGTLELRDCVFYRPLEEGIDLRRATNTGTVTAVTNCAMIQCGTYSVDGAALDDLPAFELTEALGNTLGDYIRVTDASLATDTTITIENIPNLQRGALVLAATATIPSGVTLTVGPEVVIKWEDSVQAFYRAFTVSGTLRLLGGRGLPVVVTSFRDDDHGSDTNEDGPSTGSPGDWRGLHVLPGGLLQINRALLRFGGNSGRGATQSDGGLINMWKTVVEHSESAGLSMTAGSGQVRPRPDVRLCVFRDNGTYPMDEVALDHVPGFRDNEAGGNTISDAMRIRNGTVTIDSEIGPDNYPGGALFMDGPLHVRQASLTLKGGTIVKANNSFTIGAFETPSALHFRGTGFDPVVVTSVHDDTLGGDLMKDGAATMPAPNDWTGMTFSPGASGSLENVLLRYGNSSVNNNSPSVSIRSVRVENDGNVAFRIAELDGDAENLVAIDCFQGIYLSGGTFDLVHATIVNSADHGVTWFPQHTGNIRNSIVWNSGNQNYAFGNLNRIFNSNGVPGTPPFINGNIYEDPQFVDPANGDLHLQPTSSCVDAADYATAAAVVTDHEEFSRLMDPTLSGILQPDMGAYERSRWQLEVKGRPHIGSTMLLELKGSAPGYASWYLSTVNNPVLTDPWGFNLIDFGGANPTWLRFSAVDTPHLIRIPFDPALVGLEFGIQGHVTNGINVFVGQNTNLYRACVLPFDPYRPKLIATPPQLSGGRVFLR